VITCFTPTQTAIKNLERENVLGKVFYTGDISVEIIKEAIQLFSKSLILNDLQLLPKSYVLFTMHRAENTDSDYSLVSVICAFEILSKVEREREREIVFRIHPRTANILEEKNLYGRLIQCKTLRLIQPVGYIDFIKLTQNSKKIITDSGGSKRGILLGVPCITIRKKY
jgi:UDP-N-acetylglucosamine 2-epimerase